MSEQRFKVIKNFQPITFVNMANGKHYDCEEVVGLLNELNDENEQLKEENKYLKKRIEVISDELYCKDRKLEELGVPIECCDTDE